MRTAVDISSVGSHAGYVQPNKYGAGRWRARIGSGIYSIEYNPAFAITNWTTIIKIPSVTLVNA